MKLLDKSLMTDMQLFEPIYITVKKACITRECSKQLRKISGKNRIDYALPKIIDTYCYLSLQPNKVFINQLNYNAQYTKLQPLFTITPQIPKEYYKVKILNWQLILILCNCRSTTYEDILQEVFTTVIESTEKIFGGSVIE